MFLIYTTLNSEVRVRLNGAGKIGHPGPSLVYISRAPGDNVKAYSSNGDWFKIYQDGVCNNNNNNNNNNNKRCTDNAWCSWDKDSITAKIPAATPSGEYVMRFEHIGTCIGSFPSTRAVLLRIILTRLLGVKVQNGGSGSPGPIVKFPGAYKNTDLYATISVYNGIKPFTFPSPAVWSGGSGGGSIPGTGCAAMYG
ncbi:hypothetical protein CC79DRAFT_1372418 [Sarocladium strictum]